MALNLRVKNISNQFLRSTEIYIHIYKRVSILCGFVHYLVCRKGPLDTSIICTTTISVNRMYSTSIVVIVPTIWLYMTVVVVAISFSIIVSCIFISLSLVTVGIVCCRTGSNINVVIIIIFFDGENISFEARLVIYIYPDYTSQHPRRMFT